MNIEIFLFNELGEKPTNLINDFLTEFFNYSNFTRPASEVTNLGLRAINDLLKKEELITAKSKILDNLLRISKDKSCCEVINRNININYLN